MCKYKILIYETHMCNDKIHIINTSYIDMYGYFNLPT